MRSSLVRKLRQVLLPPESPQELFLRTLYHRLNASPFFVRRQINRAEASYKAWSQEQYAPQTLSVEIPEPLPVVIFLFSIAPGEEQSARATIDSLIALRCDGWQVQPVATAGVDLTAYQARSTVDGRLHQPLELDVLTLTALPELAADFVVFCRAGDVFHPALLDRFHAALAVAPVSALYYTDCEHALAGSASYVPFFKPAASSPELMLSFNYLSRGFVRTTSLAGLRTRCTEFSDLLDMEYALLLELLSQSMPMQHIPAVLVRLSPLPPRGKDKRAEFIAAHYRDLGMSSISVTGSDESHRVNWDFGNPSVSLIILNQNHADWLRNLIDSIFTLTDYHNYSIIVVDNQSSHADVLAYYRELQSNERVQVVHYDCPFNYSEAINIGVGHSGADVVVLLNNDMQVTDSGWLRELVQWTMHPGIGVVGGKLLHRDRSIQHAGIILGMNGFIGHLYLNAPEHYHGLAGSVDWYRNYYALTGACQAIRRDLFHLVGGYDERFRLAFGDIDFCLRVVKTGLRNLYNPNVVMTHFEGGSRGYETPVQDILLGYEELLPWLEKDDPYFSPNLTYEPIPACAADGGGVDARLANIQNRKQALLSIRHSVTDTP